MQRRGFLAVAAASGAAVAGCSALDGDSSTPVTGQPGTQQPTARPVREQAAVTWSEESLSSTEYRVTATVEFRGVDTVRIGSGASPDDAFLTVKEPGTYTIAGPDTDYGPATHLETFSAFWGDLPVSLSSHVVGSQATPQPVAQPNFALAGLSASTDPNLEDGGSVSRSYDVMLLESGQATFSLSVPKALQTYYENRLRTPDYGTYVSDKYDEGYLASLVAQFERYQQEHGLSEMATLAHMTAFVQSMKYTEDSVTAGFDEYPRYPVETLIHQGGDCEDTSILLASLIRAFGYGAILLSPPGHMAVGLKTDGATDGYVEHNGAKYTYVETTGDGWLPGQIPETYRDQQIRVFDTEASPSLVFSFAIRPRVKGGVSIEAAMKNVGTAVAQNARFRIEFEDRNGNVTSTAQSDRVRLAEDGDTSFTLSTKPPRDRELRAHAGVIVDGRLHDDIRTEFRKPESAA